MGFRQAMRVITQVDRWRMRIAMKMPKSYRGCPSDQIAEAIDLTVIFTKIIFHY